MGIISRTANAVIKINDKNVTKDLMPYLISMEYTDKSDDELDDLQIVLDDREKKFQSYWMPKIGSKITASILTKHWKKLGDEEKIECGDFEVDEIELAVSFQGGDIVTIKALPAVVKSSLMQQKKTRYWENVPMVQVIADIAGEAGLDTYYKAPDIVFVRVEQREEHDLEFLQRICKEQGLRLCLKKGKIIVYMGQTADATPPIKFERKLFDFGQINFKHTMNDIYKQCVVGYTDPNDSETKKADFTPQDQPGTGKTLTINQRVEDPAQAERIGIAALRDKNSREYTGSFSGMGDTRLIAGKTIELKGFNKFDMKYVIKQVSHKIDFNNGYTVDVEFEKALEY